MDTVIFTIHNMSDTLSHYNVNRINELTELNFVDVDNVTYQMLIDARTESLGMAYGYPRYKNEVLIYILPSIPMGLVVDTTNTAIKQYTLQEYLKDIEPTLDPYPDIEI